MPPPAPTDWNPQRDLLVVMGTGAEAEVGRLLTTGLSRMLAIVPEGLRSEPTAGVSLVHTEAELKPFIWSNNIPIRRISVRLMEGGGVDQATAKSWLNTLAQLAEQHRSFHATMANLGPLWARNGIANAAAVAANPMIGDFADTFKGVPMIVVGAGPSLGKNIAQLAAAQGKAIIVAIHRTLESLHRANITADLTIAVEPRDVRHQYMNVGLEKLAGSILSTAVHPNLQTTDARRVIHATSQGREEWLLDPEDRQHEALSLGTVSHSAVSLGRAWGCDPIILVGQDLAFPGGAVYHAEGADGATQVVPDDASGQWRMAGTSAERTATLAGADADPFDMVEVEGYDGEPVMTATSFNDFRLTLEHMAADWAPDCTLINATEGGAKIHGWQQARLQDVLAQLPEIGLDVETRLAAHEDCDIQADRGQRTLALMDTLKNQLDAVASLCEQCLAQIDRCLRAPTQKNLAALEPIESKLKATARTIAPLTLATQHQLTVIVSRTPAVKDLKGSLALSRTLYAVIGTEAKALLQAFND
jgi:hypothetical protein